MREILFRGKRVDNGEWIEGFYVRIEGAHKIYTGNVDIYLTPLSDYEEREEERHRIVLKTLGQFTGLADKNGVKIFEGDIIINDNFPNEEGFVYWKDGAFYAGKKELNEMLLNKHHHSTIKIIGNIHDNPELIGGE